MMTAGQIRKLLSFVVIVLFTGISAMPFQTGQAQSTEPPQQPVKLIFIHHSTGENWLTDDYGDLGKTLAANNYFVSDTNYGWGPNGIGDRTDIPNWTEWFSSEQTSTYMQALFNESGQNSGYTRTFDDPGGENTIVMFKSCFPNSALEGSPTDAPDPEGWLSVGHAKYVYNEILKYIQTRPDKLFIVITAPPLSDGTYAANARAFNEWLVNEWLAENDYPLKNVAVFDFYNILTSPDAHHRIVDGKVEHTITHSNTLAYPSGDDHPSVEGSRKATEEFLPMLNYFYATWQTSTQVEAAAPPPQATGEIPPTPNHATPSTTDIDSFDSGVPDGTAGWQAYTDDTVDTTLSCTAAADQAQSGGQSLKMEYAVAAGGWATCDLSFDAARDWSGKGGIGFYIHAGQAGQTFSVNVFGGSPDARETYTVQISSGDEAMNGWQYISLPWSEFKRVEWEENAGAVFSEANQTLAVAFGFAAESAELSGVIYVDQLGFAQAQASSMPESTEAPAVQPTEHAAQVEAEPTEATAVSDNRLPFCGAGIILPLGMLFAAILFRRMVR